MLRSQIVSATTNVLLALRSSGVVKAIASARRPRSDSEPNPALFAAFQNFSVAASRFGEAEREILRRMNLEELLSPTWWALIVPRGGTEPQSRPALSMIMRVEFVTDHLPALLDLLKRDTDPSIDSLRDEIRPDAFGPERLILILPEVTGKLSSPARVTEAIDSISILYIAVADLFGSSSSDLAVASCDSGSDKVFDFTGLAEVVEKVKELILSIWDRVVYHKELKTKERIDTVAKTLPIFEHIAELERTEKLSRESAELFRRRLTEGTTKFLETGATIPEIGDRSTNDPAKLLQAKQTLLLEAPKNLHHQAPDPRVNHSNDRFDEERDRQYKDDGPVPPKPTGTTDDLTEEEIAEALQAARRRKQNGA
jgi:hypothetical protein